MAQEPHTCGRSSEPNSLLCITGKIPSGGMLIKKKKTARGWCRPGTWAYTSHFLRCRLWENTKNWNFLHDQWKTVARATTEMFKYLRTFLSPFSTDPSWHLHHALRLCCWWLSPKPVFSSQLQSFLHHAQLFAKLPVAEVSIWLWASSVLQLLGEIHSSSYPGCCFMMLYCRGIREEWSTQGLFMFL